MFAWNKDGGEVGTIMPTALAVLDLGAAIAFKTLGSSAADNGRPATQYVSPKSREMVEILAYAEAGRIACRPLASANSLTFSYMYGDSEKPPTMNTD